MVLDSEALGEEGEYEVARTVENEVRNGVVSHRERPMGHRYKLL